MGVPAFFRWLSKKYASIVVHCSEEVGEQISDIRNYVLVNAQNIFVGRNIIYVLTLHEGCI